MTVEWMRERSADGRILEHNIAQDAIDSL